MKGDNPTILQREVAGYLDRLEPARDALLAEMEAYAHENRQPISGPEVASFLAVTTRLSGAKRIVEVGTNIGYGAIVLARAAGPDARVTTIELNPATVAIARGYIEKAGLSSQISVVEGDALAVLAKLEGGIDLVYIDCVKEHYPQYLDLVLPKLSAKGAIIADNVLWRGEVAGQTTNERLTALRAFNKRITHTAGLRAVVLPLGDGVAYAVKS